MCRMGAFYLNDRARGDEHRYVFDHVRKMAKEGEGSPHADGWGCRLYKINRNGDNENAPTDWYVVERHSVRPIYESDGLIVEDEVRFVAGIVHARQASTGMPIDIAYTHPFSCGDVRRSFAHNGTIYNANLERFKTDTLYYCDYVFRNFPPGGDTALLAQVVAKFAARHRFSGLNFLMLDEFDRSLFVCCLFSPNYKSPTYFVMHYKEGDCGFFVFSEPPDDSYSPMDNGQILRVRDGRIIDVERVSVWES